MMNSNGWCYCCVTGGVISDGGCSVEFSDW